MIQVLFSIALATGQPTFPDSISLHDAIEIAHDHSVSAVSAKNRELTAYWQYKSYQAEQLPEISFSSTLPKYRRSYGYYQLSDGSYTFVKNNNIELYGEIQAVQNIPFTGGQIRLSTSLDYIRQLGGASEREYLSNPITLTLVQPLFAANHLSWAKKIEPVKFEQSKRVYDEDMVQIALTTTTHYFNALLAQSSYKIALDNYENAQLLAKVAKERRKMGQISLRDLDQLNLQAMQAKGFLMEAESGMRSQLFQLKTFLGFEGTDEFDIITPITKAKGRVKFDVILNKAMQQNSFAQDMARKALEAAYQVAVAKGNQRKIDIFASVGYSGIGDNFHDSYSNTANNQIVEVGMNIPLLDWGKRKAKVHVAKSQQELAAAQINESKLAFHQQIFLLVENYNNQASQLEIANESNRLAQDGYTRALQIFMSGDNNILTLNDARNSRDTAQQRLIHQIFQYWSYYFQLEMLCHENIDQLISMSREIY